MIRKLHGIDAIHGEAEELEREGGAAVADMAVDNVRSNIKNSFHLRFMDEN